MDFSNFDPTEAVLIKAADHLNDTNVGEEEEERPFGDENPCILCGNKAFANYVDLNLATSTTAQSSTPVRKKLRDILKKNWIPNKDNNILCLACYDLVDRYDSLEAQLNNLRENIEEKYIKTCAKKQLKVKTVSNQKTKRGRPKAKDTRGVKKSRKSLKSEGGSDDERDEDYSGVYNEDRDDGDSDYSDGGQMGQMDQSNENCQVSNKLPIPPAIPAKPPEEPPSHTIYDQSFQMFQGDQKLRIGSKIKGDNGMEISKCAYCQLNVAEVNQLINHVYSYHVPELVDVAIPPELGMGNTMNCGVQLSNVSEPIECPKEWACIYCDAAFRARTNMSSHFKEKHTPYKPFSCNECKEAFRKAIDLNRHKLYFCPQRTVSFAPKRKYKKREQKDVKPSKKKSNGKNESPDNSE